MTQLDEPSLGVQFEGLDLTTFRIKSYSIDSAYMTSTDAFSFTMYEPEGDVDATRFRGLELQPVSLYLDGNLQVRGRVEITEVGQGPGLTIKCEGRDYMADLVECHVDPALAISENMKLEQVVKLAAGPVGIDTVSFDASVWRNSRVGVSIETPLGPRTFQNAPLKNYKANPGEGIFQFLSRICARFGCTVQPTMERNSVLLGAPDYVQSPAYSVQRSISSPTAASNNVLRAVARRNYTKYPTVALVSGRTGGVGEGRVTVSATSALEANTIATYRRASSENFGSAKATIISSVPQAPQETTIIPSNVQQTILDLLPEDVSIITQRILPKSNYVPTNALYRLFYMRDNIGKDVNQIMNVAARAAAERLKDCLQYEIVFRGHKDVATGRTYAVDTVIQVEDEVCDISGLLWVEHVRFNYDENEGPTTTLTCWRPGSFGIGAQE